jgi:predicted anti-sigma-YlaC factor YlaD
MTLRRRLRSKIKSLKFRFLPGHMTCAQADAFIVDYLEDRIPLRQQQVFERHLQLCPPCKRYLDRYRATLRLVGDEMVPTARSEDAVPEALVQAILKARSLPGA